MGVTTAQVKCLLAFMVSSSACPHTLFAAVHFGICTGSVKWSAIQGLSSLVCKYAKCTTIWARGINYILHRIISLYLD